MPRRLVPTFLLALATTLTAVVANGAVAAADAVTFVPYTFSSTNPGSGSATVSTDSSNADGSQTVDAVVSQTNPDPNVAAPASAFVEAGGTFQLSGNFPAGNYSATVTLDQVNAAAQATGTGTVDSQFDPEAYCSSCNFTGGTTAWIVQANEPALLAPSQVSHASYTISMTFTLTSAQTSIKVGGVNDSQLSSNGTTSTLSPTYPNPDYGTGQLQISGVLSRYKLSYLGS